MTVRSKPNPAKSEGGRIERKAILKRLRRRKSEIGAYEGTDTQWALVIEELDALIAFVLTRDKRYSARKGGL